jgi:PIN domain nuclease of toxin-antitoxin system
MRLLLDTHSLLWAIFDPKKLSEPARAAIKDQRNDVAVSVVSFWEISLKYALGKLELVGAKPEDLPETTETMGIDILQVSAYEAASFHKLPKLAHKDPFDRLIIWQAIQQRMHLISKDRSFEDYKASGLKIFW